MRRNFLSIMALLPLFLGFAFAAQNWAVDPPGPWGFSSEESGGSSYLGVDIADITPERLSALKLKEEKGVEVTMVDQDAPAGKAGMKEHDVILTMNGTSVESGAQLRRMIRETPAGRIVTFGLSRDGQPMSVKVQLADRQKEFSYNPKPGDFHVNIPEIHVPDIDIPSINMVVVTSSARSGLTVENISPQLGEFFGVKNGNGVLVRSVEKGSRAEKAGFRAGDVIIKVNDHPVHDTSDFTSEVRSRSGNSISVGVVRDKKEQNLNLSLPQRKESSDLREEESFDEEPQFEAEWAPNLNDVRDEVARLRPQIEIAERDARKAQEEVRKSLCKAQKEYRKQSEQWQKEFRKQQEELRKELEHLRQTWSKALEI